MTASAEAIQMAGTAARAAAAKLAENIVVIDVSAQLVITDCFVIASAVRGLVCGGSSVGACRG